MEGSAAGQSLSWAEFISTSQKIGYLLKIKIIALYFEWKAESLSVNRVVNGIICVSDSWLCAGHRPGSESLATECLPFPRDRPERRRQRGWTALQGLASM